MIFGKHFPMDLLTLTNLQGVFFTGHPPEK